MKVRNKKFLVNGLNLKKCKMALLVESVKTKIDVYQDKHSKEYYIEGIFAQADVVNNNNRIYPYSILKREVDKYNNEYVNTGRSMGELDHPKTPSINLDRVSHKIVSLTEDTNTKCFYGKAKILDTPMGNIVKTFIKEDITFGVSTRGTGDVKKNVSGVSIVQNNFSLKTIDIVSNPSAPDAFVQGLYESADWLQEFINIKDIEKARKVFNSGKKEQREKIILESFQKLLNTIK